MKNTVLVFLLKSDSDELEVCLGRKKTGHGLGKWNGFGGKIEEGESSKAAAIRELKEESEASLREDQLVKLGDITYREPGGDWHVDVYICGGFDGDVHDSGEMQVQWFQEGQIPYDEMWPNDKMWLPLVLGRKEFKVEFWHDGKGKLLDEKWTK